MSISIQQISYIHPDKEVLFSDLNFAISKGQKLGLVGNNGCGKSTLLQIIAGQLSPSSGVIVRPDELYYIPQHFGQYDSLTIAQALRIERKQQALHAILSGDASNENFVVLDDDWNIEERSIAALDLWGLGQFTLSYPMNLLSGGEKTRVFLAGMDIHHPPVILMDEPTNHLDSSGRQRLYDWVEKCRSTLLVVSHDRTLLNLLPEICELEKHQINYYGGNYEFYKEQKTLMQEALQQRIEEKEKALRIARKVARETAERRDKQNVRGEKNHIKKGVPRIVLNALQGKSEKSTSKLNSTHQEKAEKLTDERNQLRSSLSPTATLKTDFNSSSFHTGKILVTAKEVNFGYHPNSINSHIQMNNEANLADTGNHPSPDSNDIQDNSDFKQQLWQTPISFQLKSGDRLRIEGANGSGKTTLLKLITGQLRAQEGNLTRMEFTYVYLNQEYSIIDNRNSILEQAYAFNNRNLPEHEIKTILNRYLFPASEWDKSCRKLSGGEKMRLAFCCLMISNNTPDMFILDEPTNNLDIQSIEIITATIKNYTGTVIVISHDDYFIQEIGIEQRILLS
ncbi:ATP-binding cassette domain-containing protein [Bacteroides sp. BFG-638]|uniref:ABC-F family ATP-binding cassette domain-containing protein n=1 Tax=Bacteroides vicugnae TaxID=3037989 RepID=A0ABU5HNF6_9BACE|nr:MULTISPECIES: ABC-F family ATP-binding cassette domain-containing protein [unclassified Bacteroides]MCS2951005.1 ATP-binding cassette domain-containing protein [Bacteroides sp. BFG-638]MCS3314604.1 ATP-binding cassette domain-containing protein [Bacteroides sp. BFG-637]MDY7254491.1 ABC-F family ATP-binding cassette domain-containing protein [Bacteroides sp. A1-P5]MDY7257138.1 ABC-F family ATP-binding cassette domain-containing protein [Bacteroides sp. A2-P53]